MNITTKKISVIMGIYNCADTLPEAIESILHQTYTNWHLILCDDGSSDNTYETAKKIAELYPEKITLLRNDRNMGLNATLNHCLAEADGSYIARMDGDDLSMPNRFEKEIQALQSHPEISIVSTPMQYFDQNGVWGSGSAIAFPQKRDFLYGTPFCHAPCMVKKEAYDAVHGYSEGRELLRAEDYHLWIKLYAAGFRGMNLEEPLYQMRDDRNAFSRRKFQYRITEFRVRCFAVHTLHLPLYGYIMALRPILIGLLPEKLYEYLHKKRMNHKIRTN